MEEAKKTDIKPNYIDVSNDGGNIFNELSGDLWDLDFGKQGWVVAPKKDILHISYMASSLLLTFAIIALLTMLLDTYLRLADVSEVSAGLPFCSSYLTVGVTNYENNDCKTLAMVSRDMASEKKKLEEAILANLIILVPTKIQLTDIVGSPKVQFIQEQTGDSRISIGDAVARFMEIKTSLTSYQWEDIECNNLLADEKGLFSVSCEVYGGALIAPWGVGTTQTSREKALAFLEALGDMKNGFQISSYPKSLDIAQYSTADGIKSVFSTKTSLELKLKYLPANKM